jgi:hypothetical protein
VNVNLEMQGCVGLSDLEIILAKKVILPLLQDRELDLVVFDGGLHVGRCGC